ncbi:peptidase C14 caspase catalytic subunit p20 [Gloeothece citriformis PCC 7424]|uniref:Peptidase C14 caspase catalytic subunit p20 n=1 Tax=Gloeothece citriformis (strain PCC 7424) TaxID=65393 RepID=B7KG22_GLOC7|nr:caspase family protein [Gloeothece citriformis]ACK69215.1 peptidase C14 caspase catalytic subunit p20 [Gloeothece citriformis PCC 7424]
MGLDRRNFLQRAGLGVLTLGIHQTGLSLLSLNPAINSKINRYYKTLAAPTPRKLALLVGINDYGDNEHLKGCITDVERQQDLLIHRFGFQPQDILTLTGRVATREGIEQAFLEHLSQQALSSDVVVFHFSGYGSRAKLPTNPQPDTSDNFRFVDSFIPSDGILPSKKNLVMNDVLLETLMLLGQSLLTDKFTLVLDTSHYSSGKLLQGNLRIRSFPDSDHAPNTEELAFQEQLKAKIKEQHPKGKQSPTEGIILSAAKNNQIAAEIQGDNWSSGLFTYALTQYLWQITPASKIIIALSKTTEQVEQIMGSRQIPTLNSNTKLNRLAYYLMPETLVGAEGVITKLDNKTSSAQGKLTGLPPALINYYRINSRFKLISAPQVPSSEIPDNTIVQLTNKDGLTFTVQPVDKPPSGDFPFQVGQQLQEWIRVLPRQIGLLVALDQSLEKIERVDATSAFSGINIVSPVINPGENLADCLFARVAPSQDDHPQTPNSTESASKGYGLLWPGGLVIPNTVGKENEAVKSAIQRLSPQLETLLAAKLWRLTVNEHSSWLGVSATLEKIAQTPQPLVYRSTRQAALMTCGGSNPENYLSKLSGCPQGLASTLVTEPSSLSSDEIEGLPKFSIGTPIQYRLENHSDRPIYCLLFALDATGSAITLYSPQPVRTSPSPEPVKVLKQPVIEPGKTIILPKPSSDLYWRVSGPQGLVEVFIVCSVAPFEKTLEALAAKQSFSGEQEQILTLPNPLDVTQALLQDLHRVSDVKINLNGSSSDSYVMDVSLWATLSFIYQVVE